MKNDKIKNAVKDQIKEITSTSKSEDDWGKDTSRVVAKFCDISKGGQRQKTAWWSNEQVKISVKKKLLLKRNGKKWRFYNLIMMLFT